jgi:UDP-glucose 4-epimerase
MSLKDKKVLVTGGCGFIGSHLCEAISNEGANITVIDDLSTGILDNIKSINCEFIKASITELDAIKPAFKDIDLVFHLASMNCVPQGIEKPINSNKINIIGTLNVLMAAKEYKVKRFVNISSSSVYSGGGNPKKNEDMELKPDTPYGVEKLTSESYCEVFRYIYGLKTISLRYFSVYGKRQRCDIGHAAVIPVFIERIKNNLPPIIYGDGEQTRAFTYIRDVVNGTMLFGDSDMVGVVNIANNEKYTVNELAAHIIRIMNKDIKPIYNNERLGDVKYNEADISKAMKFGFKPKYNLIQGLRELINGI